MITYETVREIALALPNVEDLMAADPNVYFITDHYLNYEYVLVNLKTVSSKALTDMIRRSDTFALGKKK